MRTIKVILFMLISNLLFGQPKPVKAPVDPQYKISIEEQAEMNENGIVLPSTRPLINPWKNFKKKPNRDFPASYDMRDSSWLTPVKSQSGGGCWAYSTMGAIESRLLMLDMGEFNLSDNNLKYCHKYLPERSTNGNHWMSSAYFARRSGPYLETEDPYPGGTSGPENCPNDLIPTFNINQSRYPPSQDIDAIKQTVLDFGAVWSLMYINNDYLDLENDTYYYDGTHEVNHAGCIVGWNDALLTAGGTGAWIVRNTYGSGWADNGYYYISYNDSQFLKYNGYWPIIIEHEENTTIYQYDEIGGYWDVGFDNEIAYGLVKFTGATDDMQISRIGTFVVASGCGVEIKIYSQFNGSLSGLLGSMDETIVELPGYYTFDLDSTIFIAGNQDFYIQVRYDSNDPENSSPIPIEDTIANYASPEIETGKFWIAPDPTIWPTTWYPIGHSTDYHYDLCIKAYTEKITVPRVSTGKAPDVFTNHTDITSNSIVSIGDGAVTQKGVCWNTSGNPTINDNTTNDGEGSDSYNSSITQLLPSTQYFIKAWGTNVTGTGYGSEISFTTPSCDNEMLVLNTLDAGYGSLRESFINICDQGIITLPDDLDGETINLSSGSLSVDKTITIENSSHTSGITISGSGNNLTILSGASLIISPGSKLTITGTIVNSAGQNGLTIKSSADGTASLIHHTTNVPATIQRYIPATEAWHLISSPVNYAPASIFQGYYLQYFTESTGLWKDISDPAYTLQALTGYALWGTQAQDGVFTFLGMANAGDLSIPTSSELEYGWNMLGNPYPSSIDWALLDDTWGAVYYLNGSQWGTWINGASTNGGVQYIPPMQGFFISSDGGDFDLNDAVRTHKGTNEYYKNPTDNYLLLDLSGQKGTDELYIRLSNEATPEFDSKFDAWKLPAADANKGELYSFCSSGNLAVDSRPACEFIQLGFKCFTSGIFNISLMASGTSAIAILEDTKLNTFHDLSKGSYEFVWDITDNEKRFKLHLNTVGIEETHTYESNILIYAANDQIFIKNANSVERIHESSLLRITDIMGRIVLQQDIFPNSFRGDLISIPINLQTGVYVVMVQSGEGIKTEKVFIK